MLSSSSTFFLAGHRCICSWSWGKSVLISYFSQYPLTCGYTVDAQGVKANVIFLQKGPATDAVWIYDARANVPGFTKRDRPLTDKFFADFEVAYGKDPNVRSQRKEGERFRRFTMDDIKARDYKLDITWLKDESLDDDTTSAEPLELAIDAIHNLEAVILNLKEIVKLLEA